MVQFILNKNKNRMLLKNLFYSVDKKLKVLC